MNQVCQCFHVLLVHKQNIWDYYLSLCQNVYFSCCQLGGSQKAMPVFLWLPLTLFIFLFASFSFYFVGWYFTSFPFTLISGDEWEAPCMCVCHMKTCRQCQVYPLLCALACIQTIWIFWWLCVCVSMSSTIPSEHSYIVIETSEYVTAPYGTLRCSPDLLYASSSVARELSLLASAAVCWSHSQITSVTTQCTIDNMWLRSLVLQFSWDSKETLSSRRF